MTADAHGAGSRVFLTGASGFVGGHILRALLTAGHRVTTLVRSGASLPPFAGSERVRVVRGEWTRPSTWTGTVAGHGAVVNAVGIIRERPGSSFGAVHDTAACALFAAAAGHGVGRIVQISALGANEGAASRFHLTKRAADRFALAAGVPAAVLRPSIVYGPGDHSMRLFRRLAALPVTPVPGDGRYRVQPVHVDDLARAAIVALAQPAIVGAFDLGGGTAMTFNGLLRVLARRRGRRARLLHIPWAAMRVLARLTDLTGVGPINGEELAMLRRGNVADNRAFVSAFGFAPRPF